MSMKLTFLFILPLLAIGQEAKLPQITDAQARKYWKAHATFIAAKAAEDALVAEMRSSCGADSALAADPTGEPMCAKKPEPPAPKPPPYLAPSK